jgi:hypothetical protein
LPRETQGNYHHWKASEYRSWLLYYSLPALQGILPDTYLTQFSLLVERSFILLAEGISDDDITRDHLLRMFVKHTNHYTETVLLD